jgi:hypothetical protein
VEVGEKVLALRNSSLDQDGIRDFLRDIKARFVQ